MNGKNEESNIRKRRPPSPHIVSVKEERFSPDRRHRSRRSPTPGSSGGEDSSYRKSRKSPGKHKKSSVKQKKRQRSKSRSPARFPIKIKQEKEEHIRRTHEDRQPRERWEDDYRRNRQRDHIDRGHHSQSRHRERDELHLREQRAEREFHNDRRRERRQREEQEGEQTENQESDNPDNTQVKKEQPNFELSGALLEDTNTFRGVVIKYSEPAEARMPKRRWRLYPFKNDEALPVMYIHRQSAYLLGRQRHIADIPIDHPSCSKQHAVLQYRMVPFTRADGSLGRRVRPYIIDLGSGNGTYLNNQRIEPQKYYELKEKDVLKFGFSSREYVVLHESSDTSEVDKNPEEDEDEGVDEGENEEDKDS